MLSKKLYPLLGVILIVSCTTVPVSTTTEGPSILVGSLRGTLREPPRSFLGNSPLVGGDRGSLEFRGFRFIRRDDGKEFFIRPLRDSFFQQTLSAGVYDLVRERRDRPHYKEDKYIKILTFTAPADSLINMGTLEIVLEGPPEEALFRASSIPRGKYFFRYRYERVEGADAMEAPLQWFKGKNPDAVADYSGKVVEVTGSPTELIDSSQFTLREGLWRYPFGH
jgi:hypothetical protein